MNTSFFMSEGKKLAYTDQGHGEVVLLVPGLGDLKESYRFLVPSLVEEGWRVVCLDVRGHGESEARWDDYSVVGVGKDILALIRHLGVNNVHYVGNSMAAGAGVWASVESPNLFRSATMIGPFYQGPVPLLMKLGLGPLFWKPWGVWMWLQYYSSLFPSRKPEDFASYLAKMKALMKEPGRLEATTAMMFASKEASGARIAQFATPALIMMGSRDPDFKDAPHEAQRIAMDLKASVALIEGAGHYPQSEFPRETLVALRQFWKSLQP